MVPFYRSQIRPQPAAPGALLSEVSTVIAEFPRVKLLGLTWSVGADERATPYYTTMPTTGTLEVTSKDKVVAGSAVQSLANTIGASSGTGDAANNDPIWSGAKVQFAIIDAAITPFDGDFRATLAEVERFNARMNALPGLKTTIESMPLDIRSTASIISTGKRTGIGLTEARFVVKVIRVAEPS